MKYYNISAIVSIDIKDKTIEQELISIAEADMYKKSFVKMVIGSTLYLKPYVHITFTNDHFTKYFDTYEQAVEWAKPYYYEKSNIRILK